MSLLKRSIKAVDSNKPPFELHEVRPALLHDNKKIKTLTDSFASVFDTSRLFRKEVISYEITANAKSIHYYFGFPSASRGYIYPKLQTAFKGSSIVAWMGDHRTTDPLDTFSPTLSAPFTIRLKSYNFMPLNMKDSQIYEEMVATLENLEEKEKVHIQVLIQPLYDEWQNDARQDYEEWISGGSVYRGVGGKQVMQMMALGAMKTLRNAGHYLAREDGEGDARRQPIPEVKQKLTQPGFNVQIRLLIEAKYDRQTQLSRSLTAAFRNLSKENDFSLESPLAKEKLVRRMKERKIGMTDSAQILCSMELANILKVPDTKIDCPKIQRTAPEERRVDEGVTKDGLWVGHTVGEEHLLAHLSTAHPDDAARIKLFVASPGAGKSTMIEQIIHEAVKKGHGAAIFDIADGRLYERVIAMLPDYKDKIVCVDYTDENYPPAFNFDALGGDNDDRGMIFAEFFEMMFKTDDLARTQSYLNKAALSVFSDPDSTLLEFMLMLRDSAYRNQMIATLPEKHPDLYLWWMREFPKISEARWNENIAPILVRLDNLFYNTRMRNILCAKGGRLEPNKWMKDGNIVVFNLSNGTFTEPEQRMLMSLHNAMFWNAALAREQETRKGITPRRFHLIYDEPQTYMNATPMVSRAISKARKYGVSLNFFIQEAEQIIKEAPALWKEILGMSPHMMIGPVSEFTARYLKKELGMEETEILAVKNHKFHWIMKTYVKKEAVPPVVVQALLPRDQREKVDTSHVEQVKMKWRTHFGCRTKRQLQENISARNMGLTLEEYRKLIQSFQAAKPSMKQKSNHGDSDTIEWGN